MSELTEKHKQAMKCGIRLSFPDFCQYMKENPNATLDKKAIEFVHVDNIFGKPKTCAGLSA